MRKKGVVVGVGTHMKNEEKIIYRKKNERIKYSFVVNIQYTQVHKIARKKKIC